MERITVETGKRYDVVIEGSFETLQADLSRMSSEGRSIFIITDENVLPLYGDKIFPYDCGNAPIFAIKPGENSKNIETLASVYGFLLENGADRSSVLIALGGGVVGDLTGFAAATYMRGIKYAQVPTTLLAMVDSSVGGKTAVDFAGYKNIIGAFYQPDSVYINPSTLLTLERREYYAGMAEVLKYGLILDTDFYDYLFKSEYGICNYDKMVLARIISTCVKLKAEIVAQDERDTGIREKLNFGHTFGHAIEKLSGFRYLHGECVALGMRAAMELSVKRGYIAREDALAFENVMDVMNLPKQADLNAEVLYEAMLKDKKAKSGKITYIIPSRIGSVQGVNDVTREEALEALRVVAKGE